MSKRYSIFLCVLFCAFLGVFAVAHLLLPNREFSENENRYLEQFPEATTQSAASYLFSGGFMSDFETYFTDQFPLRDAFMTVKAASELALGKTSNNDVYFGTNGTLFAAVDAPSAETVDKNLSYVEALAGKLDIPVYFSLVPNKLQVMGNQLLDPPAALFYRGTPLALSVNYLGEDLWEKASALPSAVWVDMSELFLSHAEEGLFYRTDHHWNSLGAYYGSTALLSSMGITPHALDSYDRTTVSADFLGTTYSSSGAGWVTPDSIEVFVSGEGVSVVNYANGMPEEGSLYVEEKLSVKDKYAYFLGGNTPLVVLTTEHTDAPKVLVVRDSYCDSLAPFLTEYFSEVHLFDLRYNNMSVSQYATANDIDAVIVLYSMANFLTDNNLFKLSLG